MKTNVLFLIGLTTLIAFVPRDSPAGTAPAGTILFVKTLEAVTSTDTPGTRFSAQLAKAVTVKGKVILPVGAKVTGKIATSRRTVSSTEKLTVDLIDLQAGGRNVPITTTGPRPLSNDYKTKGGTPISRAGYKVNTGTLVEFQLAQPLNF